MKPNFEDLKGRASLSQTLTTKPAEPQYEINQDKLDRYVEQLKMDQNMPMGVVAGIVSMLIGAILWAVISVAANFQIGWMAVGLGFLVGYAIRYSGKGIDTSFGIMGAILALIGCLLGNCLTIMGFVAQAAEVSYLEVLTRMDYSLLPDLLIETFSPIDLLFYGIAVYEGYRFSFRTITSEELIQHAGELQPSEVIDEAK